MTVCVISMLATAASAQQPAVDRARAELARVLAQPPKCSATSCRKLKRIAVRRARWALKLAKMTPADRRAFHERARARRAKMTPQQREDARAAWRTRRAKERAAVRACEDSAAIDNALAAAKSAPVEQPVPVVAPLAAQPDTAAEYTEPREVLEADPAPVRPRGYAEQLRDRVREQALIAGVAPVEARRRGERAYRRLLALTVMSSRELDMYRSGVLVEEDELFADLAAWGERRYHRWVERVAEQGPVYRPTADGEFGMPVASTSP